MVTYGIGISIFREKESENIRPKAYKLFKQGKKLSAAKENTGTIKKFMNEFLPGKIIRANPALGVYKGGSEPSSEIIIKAGPDSFKEGSKGYRALNYLKKLSYQDSILVYKIVKNGHPAIVFKNVDLRNIDKFQETLLTFSDNKIGGFLTYNFSLKSVTIIHVPEFDGITDIQFHKGLRLIKKAVDLQKSDKRNVTKLQGMKYEMFNVENIII